MNEIIEKEIDIKDMIYEIRGTQVMLDSDLARLYQCKNGTKSINLAVKRNINKFPKRFMFQLNEEEIKKLRFQVETTNNMSRSLPYAFTEQGVAMLATILKTAVADMISIAIMDAFVAMKKQTKNDFIEQQQIKTMLIKHDNDIKLLQESIDKLNKEDKQNLICKNFTSRCNGSKVNNLMNEIIEKEIDIKDMIYEIRGKQVMLDSDVAMLFGYETKDLNRNIKNNKERFPENYCFKLTKEEYESIRCKYFTLEKGKGQHRKYMPYVFTEYGITMLAGLLKSDVAIKVSLKIVNTFIEMKKYISNELLEQKYINNIVLKNNDKLFELDERIILLEESLDNLQNKELVNEIYFEGQIYDAYSKILDIMSKAKEEIIVIDNYADKVLLDIISRLNKKVILITRENNQLTKTDIEKYNKQYNNLTIKYNNNFHDRYIILDKEMVYHCGTSINHIGSKTFSINILQEKEIIKLLIDKITKI